MDVTELKSTYMKMQTDITANQHELHNLHSDSKDIYKQRDDVIKNIAKV